MATKRSPDECCTASYNTAFSSKKAKLSASYMREEDLDALGIFFNKTYTPVEEFMAMLRQRKSRTAFPEVARWFIGLTQEHLTFSLDLDNIPGVNVEAGPVIEERELIEYLEESSRELEKFRLSEMRKWNFLEDMRLKLVLFNEWVSAARKFVELTQDMVQQFILCKSEHATDSGSSSSSRDKGTEKNSEEDSSELQESIFCDVFARFSEMFFLLPVSGRKSSVRMHDKMVGSVPDICYYQYTPRGAPHPVLLLFCEVKREPSMKPEKGNSSSKETPWIGTRLNKKVLGQVGVELVSECFRSAFLPNVLGVIGMRTEIIFVYLTITADHVKAIRSNEDVSGKRASIHYTEAFDIMKSEDRAKILELLFWLGCVQKYNLNRYYLKI